MSTEIDLANLELKSLRSNFPPSTDIDIYNARKSLLIAKYDLDDITATEATNLYLHGVSWTYQYHKTSDRSFEVMAKNQFDRYHYLLSQNPSNPHNYNTVTAAKREIEIILAVQKGKIKTAVSKYSKLLQMTEGISKNNAKSLAQKRESIYSFFFIFRGTNPIDDVWNKIYNSLILFYEEREQII